MYTRRGDGGETSLFGPERVPKDSHRVEAYGAVDELNSCIGVALSVCGDARTTRSLKTVQRMLFIAGADLAAPLSSRSGVPRIGVEHTRTVEKMTDELLERLPKLSNFILPGGTRLAADLHLSRAVCRRAERRVVALSKAESLNVELIPFLNRLSSYLFNLARAANKSARRKEEVWKS